MCVSCSVLYSIERYCGVGGVSESRRVDEVYDKMRAVLIWNSGFGKKELQTEGGREVAVAVGSIVGVLRYAGQVQYHTHFAGVTVQHVSTFGIWGTGVVVVEEGGRGGEGRGGSRKCA